MRLDISNARSRFTVFTKDYMVLFAVLLLSLVFAVIRPEFLRPTNLMNILLQSTTISIVAIGQAGLLICGQLDLSMGQNVCLSGMVSAFMMKNAGINPWLSLLIGLLTAVAVGFINGIIFTQWRIPAFIVTLAMQNICMGCAKLITGTRTIAPLPDEIGILGRGYLFDTIPVSVIIMIGLYILMTFFFSKTRAGRNLYAIGGGEEAAYFSGINTKKSYIMAFTLAGLFAGISACILISRLNSAGIGNGSGYEFEAMIGCVIGGVAFSGGKGKLMGVLLGVMFSVILFNGMTLLNVHSFVQDVFKGIVLIMAMGLDVLRNRKKG